MENTFTTFGKQLLFGCIGLIAGVFMATGVQYVLAWTGPTGTPPNNNVAAPINVSATAQTKSGPFTAAGITTTNGLTAGQANGAYTYITLKDDESTNGVKHIHANSNLIGFLGGDGNWKAHWDSNGTSWQAGSASVGGNVSAGNVMYSQQYIDSNNGGYYVDPNGTNRLNYGVFDSVYTGGNIDTNDVWLRSAGRWASQASPVGCNFGGQVGVICGGRSDYWSVFYTCTNGVITNISLAWTGC